MEATEEELARAVRIRDAAIADPEIDTTYLTDWECLQHAMVAKDRVDKALTRMRRFQELRLRYGIQGDGSVEAAMRDFTSHQRLYPRFLLSMVQISSTTLRSTSTAPSKRVSESRFSISNITEDSEEEVTEKQKMTETLDAPHLFCQDMSQVANGKSTEAYAVRFRVLFWLLQAMHCNIPAMRSGIYIMVNVADVTWSNLSLEQDRRNKELFSGKAYPVRVRRIVVWNAYSWVRWFYRIVRRMIPSAIRQRTFVCGDKSDLLETGKGEAWTSQDLPTSWGGTINEDVFWETVLAKLRERYDNASKFSL